MVLKSFGYYVVEENSDRSIELTRVGDGCQENHWLQKVGNFRLFSEEPESHECALRVTDET